MKVSIKEIQSGDEEAFKLLFDDFYRSLCVFAYKYLRDKSEAENIAQEAFIKFWHKREKFDSIYKIKSFLYVVIHNDCLNYLRNKKETVKDIALFESKQDYCNSIISEESLRIFYQAVEKLPAQSRNVIQFSLDGLSNKEIAVEMSISENTVRSLKQTAYKKLKEALKDHYYILVILLS